MRFHDLFRNRKTKSQTSRLPGAVAVGAIEAVKDVLLVFYGLGLFGLLACTRRLPGEYEVEPDAARQPSAA